MRVVLATDGREPAAAAAVLLERLVRRDGTQVRVIAVNGFETVLTEAERLHHYDPAAGRRVARAALDATLARLREAALHADGIVVDGDPATEILAHADREHAEVVVVGAGHTRWMEALLLGSTSSAVLHSAAASVLVVHSVRDRPRPSVLLATDGSQSSTRALRSFVELADPQRCDVRVVAVAETPSWLESMGSDAAHAKQRVRREAERWAMEARTELDAAGFPAREEVVEGPAGRTLLERAFDHDLTITGSRGRNAVRRALLGSVSDTLVRHAPATLVGR